MNDQLHNKRKATSQKELKRQHGRKPVRKRILIICEDSVSAPDYFKKLKDHFQLSTAEVKIYGKECDSAPINLYQYGENYLKKDHDFEYVFFVFDKDQHESYQRAINAISELANKRNYRNKRIKAIISVPCFELWLMLHMCYSAKPYQNADELIKDLKKEPIFQNYEKSNAAYFDAIKDKIDTAINNSEKLCKDAKDVAQQNPSTLIHEIAIVFKELQYPTP